MLPGICFYFRVSSYAGLSSQFFSRTWNITEKDKDNFKLYTYFIQKVANLTYENMHQLAEFSTNPALNNVNIPGLIDAVNIIDSRKLLKRAFTNVMESTALMPHCLRMVSHLMTLNCNVRLPCCRYIQSLTLR